MCCVVTKKLMHMKMHVAPASSSLHLDDATIGMDIPLMKLYDIASPPYKAIADLLPERFKYGVRCSRCQLAARTAVQQRD